MPDMTTIIHASNEKDGSHLGLNPDKKVIVKVIEPNPAEVTFNESTSISFVIGVSIKEYED